MADSWNHWLSRWTDAGLIDAAGAERIRAFEREHAEPTHLGWPIRIALTFGALMLGAGVLLFVSAQWDGLSPNARFALTLLLVGSFHAAGALVADRMPSLAVTLHAVGTIALGAGIFLAGLIFNLDEHWPGGIMLWALGAAIAWAVLRHTPQFGLMALLVPAWLLSEWTVATTNRAFGYASSARVSTCGLLLLAIAYFTSEMSLKQATRDGRPPLDTPRDVRRMLLWIGGIAFLPAAGFLAGVSGESAGFATPAALPRGLLVVGWTMAIVLPLAVAFWLRGTAAWPVAIAALWAIVSLQLRDAVGDVAVYGWWGLGAVGFAAWGVQDARTERINMGVVVFAATVLAFYFSEVMNKLDRSASLIGFGLLSLAGGWGLDRVRRRLIQRTREARS